MNVDRNRPSTDLVAGPTRLRDTPENRDLVASLHPTDWLNPTPADRYDMVVLGGGVAGLVASAVAAGLGARVALVERALLGGDCLNHGCVPSKALLASAAIAARGRPVDGAAVFTRLRRIRAEIAPHDSAQRFTELGIDVFLGTGAFTGPDQLRVDQTVLRFRRAVLATGAAPWAPPIPGLESVSALTNESLFELERPPASLAVIGAGAVGCEIAQAMQRLGCAVTLFESAASILPLEDPDAASVVEAALRRDGVRIETGTRVSGLRALGSESAGGVAPNNAAPAPVVVRWTPSEGTPKATPSASTEEATYERVLLATGRRARLSGLGLDQAGVALDERGALKLDAGLRTTNRRIYAAGDVALAERFTHAADASARMVVRNALFPGRSSRARLRIPHCTYTDPELAHVGRTPASAAREGMAIDTFDQPFAALDRVKVEQGEAEDGAVDAGFVRVHVARGRDRIVGGTIVGRHAGELIGELTLAMEHDVGLSGLSALIHPYPTRSEALRKVGDAWQRARFTPRAARWVARWLRLSRRW